MEKEGLHSKNIWRPNQQGLVLVCESGNDSLCGGKKYMEVCLVENISSGSLMTCPRSHS